jgi:hypothetical protein
MAEARPEYMRIVEGYLEIRMKVSSGTRSSTGKSLIVVTTAGYAQVEGTDVKVNLTAIKPLGK